MIPLRCLVFVFSRLVYWIVYLLTFLLFFSYSCFCFRSRKRLFCSVFVYCCCGVVVGFFWGGGSLCCFVFVVGICCNVFFGGWGLELQRQQ